MIKCDDLETESMENEQCHFDVVKNNLIPLQVKKILLEENLSVVEEESLQYKESTKIEGLKLLFLSRRKVSHYVWFSQFWSHFCGTMYC